MIVIALAYAVHLISIPADWSPATPRVSISGPPRYAAVASGGSIAVLLKPATSLSGNATRLLVIRANGTRVMLQVQVPAIIERFGEHGKGSTCRAGNDDCPHFENVTLARDGTPFVTVAYVNGGAYPGVRRLAFVWNGQWHAIPKGSAVPAIGRPNAPDNFSIAAADSVERFAYVADFADGFPSEDLVLAARERSYMADVSGMQYSSRVARLGLGNAAAMRGQFLAGFEAGMKLVRGDPHSVAIRWHCDFANPAFVGICSRTVLGPGVAYGVDSRGNVIGDDRATYYPYIVSDAEENAKKDLGSPVLWRSGHAVALAKQLGSAYAISENGTIVGASYPAGLRPGAVSSGFVANANDRNPVLQPLDLLVRPTENVHVQSAFGISDDGRILALVQNKTHAQAIAILSPAAL